MGCLTCRQEKTNSYLVSWLIECFNVGVTAGSSKDDGVSNMQAGKNKQLPSFMAHFNVLM